MLWELFVIAALFTTEETAQSTGTSHLNTPIHERVFPITRSELFQRVDRLTLQQCNGAKSTDIEKSCIAAAEVRVVVCKASASIPDSILTLESFKDYVKPYLHCSQPVMVCKGVEIKSDEDAFQYCT